ncbi:hypothetical protein VNI00_000351 [Paramarasmius palmivorus]|uniref:non-specific serine/threonine protein kinase n=1 Tax=Paramarasmius palmivorus TaxID=297713 RepID=A0AAW0ECU1_9AGAR
MSEDESTVAAPVLVNWPCSPYHRPEKSPKSPMFLSSPEIVADYTHDPSSAYVTAWEIQPQTSPTPSFLHAVAQSTPLLPFTSPFNCPSPPLISDLPSISDECPSPKSAFSPPKPLLNPSISCFHLMGTLGCGAYGKVLLGYLGDDNDTSGNNLHAIKVLRKADMSRYGVEEVKRELRALRWIADTDGTSFLQKMTTSFQNERFVFMVLEYHPVSLAHPEVSYHLRLKPQRQSLPVSISLPLKFLQPYQQDVLENSMNALRLLAAELFLALRFLHQNGIVHQDVKPDNVMLSQAGHVVLSDFGASTTLPFSFEYDDFPVNSSDGKVTRTYHPIVLQGDDIVTFTPRYAAPELLHRNDANLVIYDEKVDWFSYGVLLYELATGHLPFQAEGPTVEPSSRRSVGDFSLAFGELEKLVHAAKPGTDGALENSHLESFIKALLVHQASDRLTGDDVRHHTFFDTISDIWEDIERMEHPPLPFPSSATLDPDVSLSMRPGVLRRVEGVREDEHSLDDDLFEEAGLRITWPVPPRGRGGLQEDPYLRDSDDSGIGLSLRSLRKTGGVVRSRSVQHDLYEEDEDDDGASEIQPFPSTASIMFPVQETSGVHHSSGIEKLPGIRRLAPSLCSDESLVDISCEADVSSFFDGDISTNIDFEEEKTCDAISYASPVWSSPVTSINEAIFSPRPGVETLMIPRSQSQRRTISGLSASHTAAPMYAGHTTTTRNGIIHPTRSPSPPKRQRRASAPLSSLPPSSSHRTERRLSFVPTHHPNKARLSLPLVNERPKADSRSRRTSLPAWSPGCPKDGYASHQKSPRYSGLYETRSSNQTASTFDRRMRKVSESWTLEEELTISVLDAMDRRASFAASTTSGAGLKRGPSRSTKPAEWDACLSKGRNEVYRKASGRRPPTMVSAQSEPLPTRKRRASVLVKRPRSTRTPTLPLAPSPSSEPASTGKRSLGRFWKKLRRLSGL